MQDALVITTYQEKKRVQCAFENADSKRELVAIVYVFWLGAAFWHCRGPYGPGWRFLCTTLRDKCYEPAMWMRKLIYLKWMWEPPSTLITLILLANELFLNISMLINGFLVLSTALQCKWSNSQFKHSQVDRDRERKEEGERKRGREWERKKEQGRGKNIREEEVW